MSNSVASNNLTDLFEGIKGARWATVASGIKKNVAGQQASSDIALLELAANSHIAAVFTQNAFCAAPVQIAKQQLERLNTQDKVYCLINAGNANAGTGAAGMLAVEQSIAAIAAELSCDTNQILPFSTGVIGEVLPVVPFKRHAAQLVNGLDSKHWLPAAEAIMTTDTVAKFEQEKFLIGDQTVTIAGIAKGAGMIKPNMATMLSYIVTDACVDQSALVQCLDVAVNQSFNRITVDGDTSTNDACVLAATGQSKVSLDQHHSEWLLFCQKVSSLLQRLAMAIIRDAEGATKFIELNVHGGLNTEECLKVAYTVAESPLVKTAFFASDANWGRILAAVGRAGLDNLDTNHVEISLNDYVICANGGRVENYSEAHASDIMQQSEIKLTINLNRGSASECVWTSDLSHDYVRINAEYRT